MAQTHPNYREVTVVTTKGDEFITRSTCKEVKLQLSIDPSSHPAWKKDAENYVNQSANEVAKFNKRFGNLNIFGKK